MKLIAAFFSAPIILKTKTSTDYPGSADVDGDGKVDVSDVNEVINIILGL